MADAPVRPAGSRRSRPQAARSRSGYPIRDLYIALDEAIAQSSADRACGLAAELACTDGQLRSLVSHLVDTFARRYISLDILANNRMAQAIQKLCKGDARIPGTARESLCEVVLIMCIGLQDHDATGDLLEKSGVVTKRDGCGSSALKLAVAIRSQNSADALAIALAMVNTKGDNAVGFRVAWDVVSECCENDEAAAAYVASALCIFSTMAPPRTTRSRRTPLLMYSVLVASRAGNFAQLTKSLACLKGDAVDRAVDLVRRSIDGVFDEIMGVEDDNGTSSSSTLDDDRQFSADDESYQGIHIATDGVVSVREKDAEWDYLWMYTTVPTATFDETQREKPPTSSKNSARPGSSKVVTVSAITPGGHIRRSRASNMQIDNDQYPSDTPGSIFDGTGHRVP